MSPLKWRSKEQRDDEPVEFDLHPIEPDVQIVD